jgi:hypothetical protein
MRNQQILYSKGLAAIGHFISQLVLRGWIREDPSPCARIWTFDGKAWTLAEDSVPSAGKFQDGQMVYTSPFQGLLYISPAGGKFEPSRL